MYVADSRKCLLCSLVFSVTFLQWNLFLFTTLQRTQIHPHGKTEQQIPYLSHLLHMTKMTKKAKNFCPQGKEQEEGLPYHVGCQGHCLDNPPCSDKSQTLIFQTMIFFFILGGSKKLFWAPKTSFGIRNPKTSWSTL